MATKAKHARGKESLLLDIGSASVGGAILTEHHTGVPEIAQVKRVPIAVGEGGTGALPAAMATALGGLLKEYAPLFKHGSIHVVLAAPWHHARIRTVEAKGDTPVSVSEKSVEQMILSYKNEAPPAAGRVDLEAAAVQVRVNGYPTSLTEAVTGSSVKINLYESEVDQTVRAAIVAAIEREFPHARASFHSFPLVATSALRIVSSEQSFSYADVGGEVTDFGVVHADGIHYLASFPIGFTTMLRSMQASDAPARLALYARGELSPEETAAAEALMAPGLKGWVDAAATAYKEASNEVPVPRTLYVLSDVDIRSWFVKGVGAAGLMNLSIVPVEPAMLQRLVAIGDAGVYDVFLALSALFFHTGVHEVIGENAPARVV